MQHPDESITRRRLIGTYLLAMAACLIWSGNFVIARGVHETIHPVGMAFWRWGIALTVVLPIAWPRLRAQWPLVRAHPQRMLLMGVVGVSVFNTLIYLAAHHTSTHHIALISSTAPVWTLLLAWALKQEQTNRYTLAGMGLAMTGAVLVILRGDFTLLMSLELNTGDMILFVGAWAWAIYTILLKYRPQGMAASVFLTVIIAIGLIGLLPFYLWELMQVGYTPLTLEVMGVYLYVGIGASVIAWFGWNHAVGVLGAVRIGLVYYTMPVFSGLLAIVFLGEPLAGYHLAGLALIFFGVLLSNLRKLSRRKRLV